MYENGREYRESRSTFNLLLHTILFVCSRDVPTHGRWWQRRRRRRIHIFAIRIYGTIASRTFVRVYINEFIIIISFMRTHFSSVEPLMLPPPSSSSSSSQPRLHQICTKACLVLSVEFVCALSLSSLHLLR